MKPLKSISTRQLVSHLADFVTENPKRATDIVNAATHPPKATLKSVRETTKGTNWHFVNSLNP